MSLSNSIQKSGPAATGRKRLLLFPSSITCGILAAIVFIAFSLLIEDRYPASDYSRAIAPLAQKITIEPVQDGLSGQVSAFGPARLETAYMYPSLSLEEILRRFSDARIDPADRRLFAYRLA
jgi:hypothetical protein